MDSRSPVPNAGNSSNKSSIISPPPFSSIVDWDEPFTDQELQAIDATEAAFLSTISTKKQHNSIPKHDHHEPPKTRRQLPSSVLNAQKRFSLSPCQANMRIRYPAMKFGGRIVYSRTEMEVEKAARELLQSLDAKKRELGRVAIGLDIEWKPTFRAGVSPGKAAVMQICGDAGTCHVMHIIHSGITSSLQLLLEDSMLLKVGVGIGNDCNKVFKDYNVSVKAVEELSYLANQKLRGEPKYWSLQSLTEMLLCKELHKPNKIRLGNWQVDVLSDEQLQYAATDAFTSWHLYQVLNSLPDTKVASEKAPGEQGVLPQ